MYIHKVMKKKIDIARSSAERDLTISATKQIEVLYNGQEREDLRSRIDGRDSSAHIRRRRLGDRCGVVHLLLLYEVLLFVHIHSPITTSSMHLQHPTRIK